MPDRFELVAPYAPTGDQPQAIEQLAKALGAGAKAATLLGVTGSGKTFTVANLVAQLNRPTLILSHNKTLAAQLYTEFKGFFPNNAVEYFVSYYDYYQPEAYVPGRDLYIEKEADINEELDKLRLSATRSLLCRRDVLIVASVSAIYGLGNPRDYQDLTLVLAVGQQGDRDVVLHRLVDMQYKRGDLDFQRGRYRVRGDVVELWPAYEDTAIRLSFFGDILDEIATVQTLTGEVLGRHERLNIYPAKHFVVKEATLDQAVGTIKTELDGRLRELNNQGKMLEAQRLLSRTTYDLEMMAEVGYCSGIENYARHLTGRQPGERPYCLFDFFPPDFLCVVDESHVTVPQIGGMFAGDRSRKLNLVEHGFRLPSALDNRPLHFDEWEGLCSQLLFVSATPADYESRREEVRAEQLVRPTGIPDPPISVRPTAGQVDDLIREVKLRCAKGQRSLVTTLTKRLAEDLSEYLTEADVRTTWLHSDIDAIERIEILQQLRAGATDCVIGVNLLREGLDLPEVSLVAIFDADKQGFLRSQTSLIQTIGRAARHVEGVVVLYADSVSPAMQFAIAETERRRTHQLRYNTERGIIPRTAVKQGDFGASFAEQLTARKAAEQGESYGGSVYGPADLPTLTSQMIAAAEELRFEEAARMRDLIHRIEAEGSAPAGPEPGAKGRARNARKRKKRR